MTVSIKEEQAWYGPLEHLLAGCLVSTPRDVSSNALLLTIYTACTLASAGLFGVLGYRRRS